MGFEFAQLGGEPKYLVKLPELSESGATMSPCYAKCSRRALRNAHEIAFVELLASALLTRAQELADAARQQGMLIWLMRRLHCDLKETLIDARLQAHAFSSASVL